MPSPDSSHKGHKASNDLCPGPAPGDVSLWSSLVRTSVQGLVISRFTPSTDQRFFTIFGTSNQFQNSQKWNSCGFLPTESTADQMQEAFKERGS
ncbi:hypothetical protein VNO77_38905 [Canavalia gladiata]|uniref:Uncharacterized protein n=1 Tax=Canavalia gladiata TaxID=3824 RepID=A0AAN9KA29_CANGL